MSTKQKQAILGSGSATAVAIFFLFGCAPSGPESLLEGKRQLDRGQTQGAIRHFHDAALLMPSNSLAWGYLGLAYHRSGSASNAVIAYRHAILCGPDSSAIRFNLGCLYAEQGYWETAREQFVAATTLNKESDLAWRWLGNAQLRLGDPISAIKSLGESLRLNPDSAEAWNWLGLAQFREGPVEEAGRSFEAALRAQANYGPAILNLAVLNQQKLGDLEKASLLYRQYLAYFPNSENAPGVRALIRRLQSAPTPSTQPSAATLATASTVEEAPPSTKPVPTTQTISVRTNVTLENKSERMPEIRPPPKTVATQTNPPPEPKHETVAVSEPEPLAPSTRVAEARPVPPETLDRTIAVQPESVAVSQPEGDRPQKRRGFFARINPLNLLKRDKQRQPTPLPPDSRREAAKRAESETPGPEPRQTRAIVLPAPVQVSNIEGYRRYPYQFSSSPRRGDRDAAERIFAEAETLRRRGRSAEAIQSYARAIQVDPSYYPAQFNLGLLSLESGALPRALSGFEAASKIHPESVSARYNFALSLKAANYPVDAANELLILLAYDPGDARAHLTLGNLYAQQFGNIPKAREHYTKVLELDPGHSQASAIHFWLIENPL